MKIGIAIDAWKLKIFQRRLNAEVRVISYEVGPGSTDATLFIAVKTNDKGALVDLCKAANKEARNTKSQTTEN